MLCDRVDVVEALPGPHSPNGLVGRVPV